MGQILPQAPRKNQRSPHLDLRCLRKCGVRDVIVCSHGNSSTSRPPELVALICVSPSSLLSRPAGGAASIRGRAGPQGGQKGDEGTCMLATVLCSHFSSQSKCPDHVCIKWAGCAPWRRENQTDGNSASDHHALGSDRPWAQRETCSLGWAPREGFTKLELGQGTPALQQVTTNGSLKQHYLEASVGQEPGHVWLGVLLGSPGGDPGVSWGCVASEAGASSKFPGCWLSSFPGSCITHGIFLPHGPQESLCSLRGNPVLSSKWLLRSGPARPG